MCMKFLNPSQVTCKGGVCALIALALVHFLRILSNDFQLYLGMGNLQMFPLLSLINKMTKSRFYTDKIPV